MKGIHVAPTPRTVRTQGGATWADLNRETQYLLCNLEIPSQ
jgi:hypothetical protein